MALTIGGGITIGGNITLQPELPPEAPTIGVATATGQTTATVAFTAPVNGGSSTITSYTATSSPGGITGALSQAGSGTINVTGLTASTSYTFTVTATNSVGTSSPSSASNSITTSSATIPIEYLVVGPGGAGGGFTSRNDYGKGGAGGSGGAVFGSANVVGSYTVTVGISTGPHNIPGTTSSLVGTGFTRNAYAGGNGARVQDNTNAGGITGYAGAGGAQGDGNTSVGGTAGIGYSGAPGGNGGGGTYSGGGGGGGSGDPGGGYYNGGAGGAGGQRNWNSSSWNNIGTTYGTGAAMNTSNAGIQGVVAIQYPDTYPLATSTTGSPTITNPTGYRVYTWTSSGSITF